MAEAKKLRDIDFSKKHFECGGKKFYVKDKLSFNRYRELQKISLEFAFSATFYDIFKHIKEAWDFLNQTKLGEAAVTLHNIMYGMTSLEDKDVLAFRVCAIWIDEEGEDPTVYDEAAMKEKIDCWAEELAVLPFIQLAGNLVPDWINVYQSGILNSLNQEKKVSG